MSRAQEASPLPARPYIGGQALLEGVMMRSPTSFAIVCRRKSGELFVRERPIVDERKGARAMPLLRGVFTLVESLKLGSEALRYSADLYEKDLADDEAKPGSVGGLSTLIAWCSRSLAALSLPIIALASVPTDHEPAGPGAEEKGGFKLAQVLPIFFALALFIAAPQAGANLINRVFGLGYDIRSVPFQLLTGAMKLTIVVGYLSLIRRVPDIRRVFQYHGAEHKTISTYEAKEELLVENARKKTTLHPRCGTTFLVMVAMVSVLVFSAISPFLPRIEGVNGLGENALLFLMKLPFLPVIAAITFEIQRVFARYCTTGPLRVLLWPGFLVQKITTIEPEDDQLEVALASLGVTLWREQGSGVAGVAGVAGDEPADVTERKYSSYDDLLAQGAQPQAALGAKPKDMLPTGKLDALSRRFREVEAMLCTPEVLADVARSRKLNEERAHLEPLMAAFDELRRAEKALRDSGEMLADPEMRELAEAEIPELTARITELEKSIQVLLLPPDPRDRRNIVLEVRQGEGGEEAALFAADIFRMLARFAERKGWRVEITNVSEASAGGYKEITALISGQAVFSQLRFEGGVHRVQRVPATEAQGRVHTSTASVVVLPEADDIDVQIDEKDLEINIAASGGPGGQGVNTTNSAVQLQHKPTGIIVKCQDERSQLKNKSKAMKILRSRLLAIEEERQESAASAERRGMVGTGERSQKCRTYNYPQNRVTDHRIGLTLHKLDKIMEGDMDELISALRTSHQATMLEREGLGGADDAPPGGRS
jgi:peptide chain release factor 1